MSADELQFAIALPLGIVTLLMGVVFFFVAIVLATAWRREDAEGGDDGGEVGFWLVLGDFVLVALDSLPFISLAWSVRKAPETAQKMKAQFDANPLIRRFLVFGATSVAVGALALFWASTATPTEPVPR